MNVKLKRDEQITPFLRGKLKIIQKREGARFSLDPIWLAHFVRKRDYLNIAELGCGTGIALFILSLRFPQAQLFGVEILRRYADMAQRSAILNDLSDRVRIVCGDYREIGILSEPAIYDLVVANPPYLPVNRVRQTFDNELATFRYEMTSTLDDVVRAASYLLKPAGDFAVIFDAQRISDLIYALEKADLGVYRMRLVHGYIDRGAERVMIEAKKGRHPATMVEPPLIVHGTDKKFSDEVESYIEGNAL